MRILVTGGAGYVGSHCVRRLLETGHDLVVYDDLRAGHAAALPSGVPLVRSDLADGAALDRVMSEGFDAVMHFAAYLDVGESVRSPLAFYENNVANTIRLLRSMEKHACRRMVFSSTCATYGAPDRVPIREDDAQCPINPYGHTKLVMEWALRDCGQAWGLGSCALRYFNAAGAASDGTIGEDHRPEIHLIPIVLQVALGQRDAVPIFGDDYPTPDGTCIRDFVHVEDLAEAHRLAVEAVRLGAFAAYNVGVGTGSSVREVIEVARRLTGHPLPVATTARRPGDPPRLFADSTRLRTELGWIPRHAALESIVASAWRWHKSHPHGYGED